MEKKSRMKTTLNISMLLVSFLAAGPIWAFNFNESPDAGVTPANAIVLPQGVTSVTGSISNTSESDVDLYQFSLDAAAVLTIEVLFPGEDANLIVFNATGQGLAGDDDDGSNCTPVTSLDGLDSCLTLSLTAGTY